MASTRARANGLRTKQACSMPGSETSSTKVPSPVSRRASSTRGVRVPAYRAVPTGAVITMPSSP